MKTNYILSKARLVERLAFHNQFYSKGNLFRKSIVLTLFSILITSFTMQAQTCSSMNLSNTTPAWNGLEFCTGYNPSIITAPLVSYTGICSNTPSYQYLWEEKVNSGPWTTVSAATAAIIPGYNPPAISNLPAGSPIKSVSWRLTVTDIANGGQSATSSGYNIKIGSQMTSTITSTFSCALPVNGSIDLMVNGGLTEKTYAWTASGGGVIPSGQEIEEDPTGLNAGTFSVIVSDGSCTNLSTSTTLNTSGNLTASISSSTNVACFGGSTGAATVTPSQGIAPYNFSWSPSGGSLATASSLAEGLYVATVTDAGGCTVTTSVSITEPATAVSISSATKTLYNGAELSCSSAMDGEITVTASGGTGALQYSKDNGSNYQTGNVFSSLAAGTYNIVVKDANNCTATVDIIITAPNPISGSGAVTSNYNGSQLSCSTSSDGEITVSASGGTGALMYSIDGGSYGTSNVFSALAVGPHTLSVKDANGCIFNPSSVTIIAPNAISVVASSNSPTYAGSTANFTSSPTGGTGAYTYSWSVGANMVNNTVQNPSITSSLVSDNGIYTLTVTDANGCTATDTSALLIYGTTLYVNDNSTVGDTYTSAIGNDANAGTASAPFATLAQAISVAQNTNTIKVDAGTYAENIIIDKEIQILGPNDNIDPCSGTRVAEAVLTTAVSDIAGTGAYSIMDVQASNVTIKGLTLDGDNTSITTGKTSTTSADIDIALGITRYVTGNNLVVSNNIIKNVSYYGVELYDFPSLSNAPGAVPSAGNEVTNNKIQDLGTYDATSGIAFWGGGVLLYNNQYTKVENNCMTNVRLGVQTGNFYQANPGSSAYQSISNNTIQSRRVGIFHNLHYSSASPMTMSGNTITTLDNSNDGGWRGILLGSLAVPSTLSNNTINGTGSTRPVIEGINVWNCQTAPAINGGTISNVQLGINVNNYEGYSSDANNTSAIIDGVSISTTSIAGIKVNDNASNTNAATVSAVIQGNTNINNSSVGLWINGGDASATFSGAMPATFAGQTTYIDLTSNGTNYPAATTDATQVVFDGLTGGTATNVQNFAIENKINHKIDAKPAGFVLVKTNSAFITDINAAQSSTNNDYTRVRNAVEFADNNWSINLNGSFDWTETNAATSWSLGNDGVVSAVDDYSIIVPANRNGITFTAPEGVGTASITGPGDVSAVNLEGVLVFDGGDNKNWTISNMTFNEFDMPIGMFNGAGGTDAFDGTTITNNVFNIATDLNVVVAPTDVNQNIGLHYSFGANQTISNNVFNIPGDGVSNGTNYSTTAAMQSNTSGGAVYNGLTITGNTINVLNAQSANPQVILGIWENSHGHSSNITISNNQFLNLAPGNNPAFNLQRAFRMTSHSSATTAVTYSGNTVSGANIGFQWLAGQNFSAEQPISVSGNIVNNSGIGFLVQSNGKATFVNNDFDDVTDNTVDIQVQAGSIVTAGSSNQFAGDNYYVQNLSATAINLNGDSFDESNNFRRSDRVYDALDNAASGLVSFDGTNKYVSTPATGSADETIQRAVDASLAGNTIYVEAGTFNEDVNINKQLTLIGAGHTNTTVVGPIGGGGATMQATASGIIIDGFKITRDGNNTTDWNNAGLNTAGIAIQSTPNSAEVRNCNITGMRTGIDINNSNGNNIHNNIIDNNRTGMIFRNQTDNTNVSENFITNNWTVGVLFLDGSGGTNSPVQTAANSTFNNNNISGNWYGEVVDRQTGGSLPAPGASGKNFDCNWYGASSVPTTSTANSSEPGYAAQIPVMFGGTAVAPAPGVDILGLASANIDFINWTVDGTDNAPTTVGFQPLPSSCSGTPIAITSSIATDILCGPTTGSIAVTFSGGTSPYTIAWTGGTPTAATSPYTISPLSVGTYTITVTDVNGTTVSTTSEVKYLPVTNTTDGLNFATIQAAIDASTTSNNEVLQVCAGTYVEYVNVNKSLTINGAQAGIDPRTTGTAARSGGESIILPPSVNTTNGDLFTISANNVVVDGFTLNGNNTLLSGGTNINGVDIQAARGFSNAQPTTGVNNLSVKNNIMMNLYRQGVYLFTTSFAVQQNNLVEKNVFDNIHRLSADGTATGVYMENEACATVSNNKMTRIGRGIMTATLGSVVSVPFAFSNNEISSYITGIWVNNHHSATPLCTVSGNTITSESSSTNNDGIRITSHFIPNKLIVSNNSISAKHYGYWLWNCPANTVSISGGSITGGTHGVYASNRHSIFGDGGSSSYTLDNVVISNPSTQAIWVEDNSANTNSATVSVAIQGNTAISNTTNGLLLSGGDASASFLGATPATFTGQTTYIDQMNNGSNAPSTLIDATAVSFDGQTGATATLAQNYAIENKINHKVDNSVLGFVRVKAAEAFVTTASGSIQRGIDAASATDIVNVDAGTFSGNVIANKAIIVKGANAGTAGCNTRSSESVIQGEFILAANNINIDGFELTGTNARIRSNASLSTESYITIQNNFIHATTAPQPILHGFGTGGGIGSLNWTITRNKIEDIQAASATAMALFNITNVSVTENCITHANASFSGRRGINADGLQTANISNNIIDMGDGSPTTTANAPWAIQVSMGDRDASAFVIDGNTIINTYRAIQGLSQRNLTGMTINNNTITNVSLGIDLNTGGTAPQISQPVQSGISINNNFISTVTPTIPGGIGAAVRVRNLHEAHANGPVGFSNVNVNDNSFTVPSSDAAIINNNASYYLNATCNWYGTIVANTVASKIVGNVTYSPYLINGTDDQPSTTGFQPEAGSCTGSTLVIASAPTTPNQFCQEDGTITLNFSGGSANYTIDWSGTETGSGSATNTNPYVISGLAHGNYSVLITDANGSTATTTATIGNSPVKNSTNTTYYTTIQSAISAANNNDVIDVCAGTYTENIVVNKPLVLNGPNVGIAGNAVRAPEAILLNSTIDFVNAGNTTLDGFHILRNDATVLDQVMMDAGGINTVQHCIFERNGSATGIAARGVTTTTGGGNKIIKNNKFTGDASAGLFGGHKTWNNGIYVDQGSFTTTIEGNELQNCRTALSIDDHSNNNTVLSNNFTNNGTHIGFGGTVPTTGSYTLGANNFNTSGSAIINLSNVAEAFRLNITSSTYNGTSFNSLSNSDLFLVEAQMFHKDRTATRKGKVIYHANNQFVNNFISPGTKIDVIQNSIKYFDAGETINLEDGTYNQRVVLDKNGITLQGVTTTEADFILNGTGLVGSGNGITINTGITGSTIKNLTVQNYTGDGGNANAGIYGIGQNNNTIVNNVAILNNPTASGFYANGPVDDVEITNCTVSNNGAGARGIVIWNGLKTNINLSNNTVTNNTCCGIELQDGTASNVTIQGNAIDIGGGDNAIGVNGLRYGTNNITNNTITGGGRFGIEIKNPLNANAVVSGNIVTLNTQNSNAQDRAGIAVFRRGVLSGNPDGHPDQPSGVTITNNTITGYQQTSTSTGFGIVVEGNNHSVTGNTLNNNDVAVQLQAGHTPFTSNASGDGNQADLNDEYFGRGNSPYICGINIGTNTMSGNGIDYRLKTQLVSTTNLAQINSIIGGSVLNVNTSASYCSIQDAINAATAGDVLSVSSNNFYEQVVVNKAVTINGPNAAINACTGTRVAEATIDGGSTGTAFTVTSTGVTIAGLNIKGLNGIASNAGATLTATNNIVDAGATGISVTSNGAYSISQNRIESDLIGINATTSSNGGSISNNCVDLTQQFNSGANQATMGILLNSVSTSALTVNDNTITDGHYGYVVYGANAGTSQIISGGTVTGVLQGVAIVNTIGGPLAKSNVNVSGISMSGFSGTSSNAAINFHAGVYTFTAGTSTAANGIDLAINNCTIDGTQAVSPAGAGIYLGDFSGGSSVVQNVTVDESTIQNNTNRGLDARGKVAVTVTESSFLNNGGAAFGTGGNNGFSIIAQQGASITANNNFIVLPSSSTTDVVALVNGNGTGNSIIASNNSILVNGNTFGKLASNNAGNTITATCNWLGGISTATNNGLISGTVSIIPWLTNGADLGANALDGFQPTVACVACSTLVLNSVTKNVSCNGLDDGSATVTFASGEIYPFTYEWSNASTDSLITGLNPNTYSVTVTNANGCTATSESIITEPIEVTVSGIATNASCNGASDGSIAVTNSLGSTVVITNASSAVVSNSGLPAGTYTLTATAANGNNDGNCAATTTVTIEEPITVTVSGIATNVSCYGASNGSIAITNSAGSTVVITNASNVDVTSTNGSYGPGIYTLTATAPNGNANGNCVATTSVTIEEPIEVTVSGIATNVSCYGASNGSIAVTNSAGSTVVITNASNVDVTSSNGSYGPGIYTLTATAPNGNANGNCVTTTTVTIEEPIEVTVSGIATNASCNGASDGSIAVTNSLGSTVVITNASSAVVSNSGLQAGTYTLTATAANGNNDGNCVATTTVIIEEPITVTVSGIATNVSCNGASNGSIAVTNSAGSTLVITNASNVDVTSSNGSYGPGIYTLTATAPNGNANGNCVATTTVTIEEPIEVTVSGIATNVSCYGASNGSIAVTNSAGSTVVITNASNVDVTSSNGSYGPGIYTLTASAPNGNANGNCVATAIITITEPIQVTVTANSTNVSCHGLANGTISISGVSAGATTKIQLNGTGADLSSQSTFGPGTYIVTASAPNGNANGICTASASVTITEPIQVTVSGIATNVGCSGSTDGSIAITNSLGSTVVVTDLIGNVVGNTNLPAGLFLLTATAPGGNSGQTCTSSTSVFIGQPAIPVSVSGVPTHVTCNGASTGAIAVTKSLGSTVVITNSVSAVVGNTNLPAGVYTLTATAPGGNPGQFCTAVSTITINQPALITGSSNVSACTSYTWTQNNQTYTASGNYTATFTASNGCDSVHTLNLTINEISSDTTDVIACATYTWLANANTVYTASGQYSATFTNVHGCDSTRVLNLTINDLPTINATVFPIPTCTGTPTTLTATGANSYSWTNGANTPTNGVSFIPNVAGLSTYTVTGTDGNGCSNTTTIEVQTNAGPCYSNVDLKVFIQGYYSGGSAMRSTLLNEGVGSDPLVTDTIEVSLFSNTSTMIATTKTILHTDGTADCQFPYVSGNYYLRVKHRNSIETWSNNPLPLTLGSIVYDFTSASSQAEGNNQVEVETNIWAIYNGDFDQDGTVTSPDYSAWETDANNFEVGYFNTDFDGDGVVGLTDYVIWETNSNLFVSSVLP